MHENNFYLAFIVAAGVSCIVHYVSRWPYLFNSICSAGVSGLLWMVVCSIESRSISNVWPIALAIWFLLFMPVAFLVGIPILLLWPKPKPIPHGHCRNCGYNLTGNVSGICPECGERI